MARGGKREGAGRPVGTPNKPVLMELLLKRDPDALDTFIEFLMDNYKESDKLMIWMGDQIFHKAPQSIDHTTLGKELPQPIMQITPPEDA